MAGNSWQQPVAGEPSLGTLHFIVPTAIVSVNPTGSGYTTVDVSPWIPSGAGSAYIQLRVISTVAYLSAVVGKENPFTSNAYVRQMTQVADQYNDVYGFVPITASRTLVYYSDSSSISSIIVRLMGYTI